MWCDCPHCFWLYLVTICTLLWRASLMRVVADWSVYRVAEGLREDLLLQYGSLLASHRSLWQLGLSYLDHCPRLGRAKVELILPSIPQCSEIKTLRIIREAEKRNMKNIGKSQCLYGMLYLEYNRISLFFTIITLWCVNQYSQLKTYNTI